VLKRIVIIATVICVPVAFYVASQYSELKTLTFADAMANSEASADEDKAPKVIIMSSITGTEGERLICEDRTGTQFPVEYTGKPPTNPFSVGQTVEFVGHVHGGEQAYFHATQVFAR
jgi:hypothetical protein